MTHIPNKGEQLVRYYGFCSNKARGVRKKPEVAKAEEQNPDMEVDFDAPIQKVQEEIIPQMLYEDDYSQLTPYEDDLLLRINTETQ